MTSNFQPVQGMSDVASPEIALWQAVEDSARRVFSLYHVEEVRTPILEPTELFTRSIGDTTDVVQKEMYTFEDRGGRSLTLRPEGTAGVMRHAAALGPDGADARLYYLGPMFRYERPQAGRKRQFHQVGVEALGPASPAADAEIIALQQHLFAAWGLRDVRVEINTRGLPEDRAAVAAGLRDALRPHLSALCDDCRRRFEVNVLRVLDCKQAACNAVVDGLPPVTSFMGEASRMYLDEVLRLLKLLDIPVKQNPRLVRGLDYYVHTVWECRHPALGAQDAIGAGGRYAMEVGGTALEGVGFGLGLERVVTAVRKENPGGQGPAPRPAAWIVSQGAKARDENLVLAQTLRLRGVRCGIGLGDRSLKAQMRAANKAGAAFAVIRGEREMEKGLLVLKNMGDGSQEELAMPDLIERLVTAARAEVVKT